MKFHYETVLHAPGESFSIEIQSGAILDCVYHVHPEFELTFVESGFGTRFVGDLIEPFREQDLILVGGMQWESAAARRIAPLAGEALKRGILVGAICNAASFLAAHGFLNAAEHTGNTLEMLREWGGANYTGAGLYRERQAVRDGKIVTANGSGYLEFARECLLALEADTPEQIAASYAFNKHGFYRE